jgi:quercetin dioxygenase-like cupin family protein
MIAMQLTELELEEMWVEGKPSHRVKVQMPLAEVPDTESIGVIYVELEPGDVAETHTHDVDEILILLAGKSEVSVDNESHLLSSGGMVFIPKDVSHGFRNVGSETLRAVGIFDGAKVVSEFDSVIMPIGTKILTDETVAAEAN